MIKSILLVCALFVSSYQTHADPLDIAIENLKRHQSFGHVTFRGGLIMTALGTGKLGAGLILSAVKPSSSIGNFLVGLGPRLMAIGGLMTVSGVVVAYFEAAPAGELSTQSDYFRTVEGFQDYLKLPADQMRMFASMNKNLQELVVHLSEAIDQSEL